MSLKLTPEEVQLVLGERKKKATFPREAGDVPNKEKGEAFDKLYARSLAWFNSCVERGSKDKSSNELAEVTNAALDVLNIPGGKTYLEMLSPFVE